jgi:hypothetical protein
MCSRLLNIRRKANAYLARLVRRRSVFNRRNFEIGKSVFERDFDISWNDYHDIPCKGSVWVSLLRF